ncbi:hypothetical protein SAMN05216436_10375 [bacterium A37T11]|nr:hypothetical protein SAMN05216436_10375 [bacterium A37T11]
MFNYCKKHYKCIYSDTGIPNTLDNAVKKGFNTEVIKVCRWSTESPLIGIEIGDIAIPFRRRLLKRHLREENKAKMSYTMMCQNLLLAALMMFSCSKESEGDQIPVLEEQPALAVVDGRATFTLSGTEYYVNVMGNHSQDACFSIVIHETRNS